jgi:carboxypeptidase family protein/TonB-dependent receptor-like protein
MTQVPSAPRLILAFTGLMVLTPRVARAQGEIIGRVVTDSGRTPVASVRVSIARLGKAAVSDSTGRFRLTNLPAGDHVVLLRALGFRSDSADVEIEGSEVAVKDFELHRDPLALPRREITAPEARHEGKMAEFYERMKAGPGHFVTRDELAKVEGGLMQTGDVLSKVPGVEAKRGNNHAWIASGRAVSANGCAFCSRSGDRNKGVVVVAGLNVADFNAGARPACYMDVYIDGVLAFDSTHPENGLFDVNTIPPSQIEGIEVYTSAAQIPARFNRTANGCGVMVIWTRI